MSCHASGLRRCLSVPLAGALALLLFAFLAFSSPVQQVHAAGEIINVPGDYPKIQQAIDAAQPGATIVIQEGQYNEQLSITKAITLSGSNCPLGHGCGDTILDGEGKRAISITLPISTEQVTISGFIIQHSDATGLGGFVVYGLASIIPAQFDLATPIADERRAAPEDLSGPFAELQAFLERSDGPQFLEPALETLRARVVEALELRPGVPIMSSPSPRAIASGSVFADGQQVDCGGGLYSWNARVHLVTVDFVENVASTTGPGLGVVCAAAAQGPVA